MLCLACGAEMRLVEAVEDTTMLVSGYEHQTWQCSGCSSVEQRMTFTRKKSQIHRVRVGPVQVASVEPAQTAAVELVQTKPVAPAPIVPIQATQTAQADPTQSAPVGETILLVEATHEPMLLQLNHPRPPAAMLHTNASPKPFDQKLRNLMERATVLKQAAAENRRRAQFKLDWDKLRSVPAPSGSSGASSHKDRDEPVESPAEPAAAPAPTVHDEPSRLRANVRVAGARE
jgi:hypothetical protein